MLFEQEDYPTRGQKVHHRMMQKTLFISLLAIHPMVEEEGVQTHSSHRSKIGSYDQFYHYGIDTTKRQKIALWNKKYALNTYL